MVQNVEAVTYNPVEFPYTRSRSERNGCIRIEVMADSMRVGKTTAVEVIAQGLRDIGHVVTESYEDWQNNPYLAASYSDPEQSFLASQQWFIRRKWEQVRDGVPEGVYIQDVSPEMDFCYAATNARLGRMSPQNFAEYVRYYHSLDWMSAPAPDVLVYLQASDDVLIERAMASRRTFESVKTEYFLTMKAVNREWLAGVTPDYRTLVVNTDSLNFATQSQAKEILIQRVLENISY